MFFTAPARQVGGLLLGLLFPPTCQGCGKAVSAHGSLCPDCWTGLRFIEKPWCEVLGLPFAHDQGEGALSAAAIANPPDFARARSAVVHEGVAMRMVHRLKYNDRTDLAPTMARWMLRAGGELVGSADLIIAVPLHGRRLLSRRFNQSAELARALSALCGTPFASGLIVRRKATRHQVGLSARERAENVRGAFACAPGAAAALQGRRILVVDDVFTTGATVSAVARTLKKAGAADVDVLTFARVMAGDALS